MMAKIPEKKRGISELRDIQARNAFATQPPVQQLQALAVPKQLIIFIYLLSLTSAGLVVAAFKGYGPIDEVFYYAGQGCAGLVTLTSLFIFWKKPRSRHHAAFLAIISLLVLVFGSVYYIKQFEQSAHDDAQGPTRY